MARFCFLPPTKRPASAREQTTKSRTRTASSSIIISDGMLKRLEPVFIPKKRLYKRGANKIESNKEQNSPTEDRQPQKVMEKNQKTPKKLLPQVKTQTRQRKEIRRELFPQKQEKKDVRNVLGNVDEQIKESSVKEDQFVFPDGDIGKQGLQNSLNAKKEKDCVGTENRKKDEFKKPRCLPKVSKKKKRSTNKLVLEIIRKTQQSIQKIRNQAAYRNTMSGNYSESMKEKIPNVESKTSLNVNVSICIPNSGIQKSQCIVQQTGSIEVESIGYKRDRMKSFQDIQDLL